MSYGAIGREVAGLWKARTINTGPTFAPLQALPDPPPG